MTQKAATTTRNHLSSVPSGVSEDITETDEQFFFKVISTDIDAETQARLTTPSMTFKRQDAVLAVHWHPEHVPMPLIEQRINAMFPDKSMELIIPTQHNMLTSFGNYTGVEVDCYSAGFDQKVQILLHFESDRLAAASVLKNMLAHTFKYRANQLYEFMGAITRPAEEKLDQAARETGANESVVNFVRTYVKKIETLLDRHYDKVPQMSIKNKLLRNFFDCLRQDFGDSFIDRAQTFLTAVKKIVKANIALHYFYRTSEVIEEARALDAGVVIPHPEQFWPVLLADYDVDGYEVWNPQSRRYTRFLISVLNEKNRQMRPGQRELLLFMGDDTHMGEKTRDPKEQNVEKASREIGVQPAWDELDIRKAMIMGNFSRKRVIAEYRARLAG